jgi:hypothetical protein
MNTPIISDWLLIAGSLWCIFTFFDRKRRRARWARLILVASGILGLAYSVTYLILEARWLVLTGDSVQKVHTLLHHIGGLLLGFLLSIALAGEAHGRKADTAADAPTI